MPRKQDQGVNTSPVQVSIFRYGGNLGNDPLTRPFFQLPPSVGLTHMGEISTLNFMREHLTNPLIEEYSL